MIAIAFIVGSVISGLAVGVYYIQIIRELKKDLEQLELDKATNMITKLRYASLLPVGNVDHVKAIYVGTGDRCIKFIPENEQEHNHDTQ